MEGAGNTRNFEFVTRAELALVRGQKFKHRDLRRAIRALKEMAIGDAVKIKCPGTPVQIANKQKAAKGMAKRAGISIRTLVSNGWLFLERVRSR